MEGDDEEQEPTVDTTFPRAIIVDGLPVVPAEKHEKLSTVVRKFFSQVGTIVEGGLEMPKDPKSGQSLGFAFIMFSQDSEAQAAIVKANGYKLDKAHTFIVNAFEDYDKYIAIPDTERPYRPPPYEPKDNLQSWLLDKGARDQYAVRYGDETEIWWNDPTKPDNEALYARRNWSDAYVSWSPRGTYLATFHRLWVQLWGGPSWTKLLKLAHGGVKLIDFSPNEKFVVTWSPESDQSEVGTPPPGPCPARARPSAPRAPSPRARVGVTGACGVGREHGRAAAQVPRREGGRADRLAGVPVVARRRALRAAWRGLRVRLRVVHDEAHPRQAREALVA